MDSPSPRRSRAIAVRSGGTPSPPSHSLLISVTNPTHTPPKSPPSRHARPSRVPGSKRERSVPPPPKSKSILKSPPTRVRQSTYAAPSSHLQAFVDPPPPIPQKTQSQNQPPKKVKQRATAHGSIAARKSLPNPDALKSPKISGIARPVSDASPTTSNIARPIRKARASLPLIKVQDHLGIGRESGGGGETMSGTRLSPVPTSPPISMMLSPVIGTPLDFLTFGSGRESVTAIASTQIPKYPSPQPTHDSLEVRQPNGDGLEDPSGEGPTLTPGEVLSRIDRAIAGDKLALEKINEGIARIYKIKVELRRAAMMRRIT